jgi:acetylornithine deacetylase
MNKEQLTILHEEAIALLCRLISIPSFSKEENGTASEIASFFSEKNISHYRHLNNIVAFPGSFDPSKPSLLLNSHHDTVKPNPGYSRDPFRPAIEDGRLFGLGSNDAGGPLVSLIAAFLHFQKIPQTKFNLLLAATAEEEISGRNGIESLLQDEGFKARMGDGPGITAAIVGEPTLMELAVAERGLLVLDCIATGRAGHAAREEGENAIYKAMKDIEWMTGSPFEKVSPFLGPVKISVTSIETENKAHNVVPATCSFIADVRVNELYTLEEVVEIIGKNVKSSIKPRSTRLRSTSIAMDHPLVVAGMELGRKPYGSPTTSDKALMPFPALKMGPGDSARSHTADEFIFVEEIRNGIELYIQILNKVLS